MNTSTPHPADLPARMPKESLRLFKIALLGYLAQRNVSPKTVLGLVGGLLSAAPIVIPMLGAPADAALSAANLCFLASMTGVGILIGRLCTCDHSYLPCLYEELATFPARAAHEFGQLQRLDGSLEFYGAFVDWLSAELRRPSSKTHSRIRETQQRFLSRRLGDENRPRGPMDGGPDLTREG